MIDEVRYDLDFDTQSISTRIEFQRDLGTFHSEPVSFDELGSIFLKDGGERDSLYLKIAIPTSVRARNWPSDMFNRQNLNVKLPKELKNVPLKSWKIANTQGELHYIYSENSRLVVGTLWQDAIFDLIPKNSWGVQTLSVAGNPKVATAYLFGPTKTQRGGILILNDFGESAFDAREVTRLKRLKEIAINKNFFPIPKSWLYETRAAFLELSPRR